MSLSPRSATDLLGVGAALARALAAKDRDALVGLFGDPLDFQGQTPGRQWRATDPTQLVDEYVLGAWFGPDAEILDLERLDTDLVADRGHVAYRLRVRRGGLDHLVEQQAYFDCADGRIGYLRLLCSGYRPVAAGRRAGAQPAGA